MSASLFGRVSIIALIALLALSQLLNAAIDVPSQSPPSNIEDAMTNTLSRSQAGANTRFTEALIGNNIEMFRQTGCKMQIVVHRTRINDWITCNLRVGTVGSLLIPSKALMAI
jgi:hypothetical protein